MTERSTNKERFIAHLERLAGVALERDDDSSKRGGRSGENRAALAALRRGLGREGGAWETYPTVMPFVRKDASRAEETAYFIVGALFGLNPSPSWRRSDIEDRRATNFGASLAILKNKNPESDSVERRFVALLNAEAEDLPTHLRHAVSLIKSSDSPVPVDWLSLLNDLTWWESENREVQRRWARAFWRVENDDQDNDSEKTEEQVNED